MFTPIIDRVLIRRRKSETTKSAIEIPDAYRQAERRGTVVAAGQFVVAGGTRIPMSDILLVVDDVLFGEYNAEPIEVEGVEGELVLVRVQDIRGVYRGQE